MIQDFKDSDEYFDDLCKYYMEGFNLLVKWMMKHHPDLYLSGLAVDIVEKEIMSDCPFEAMAEEATNATEVMKEASADPVPDEQ